MVNKKKLCEKLINTYTDSIIVDDNGELDFEETVYNFAENIINDIKDFRSQKYYFGGTFENVDDCYRWLITELSDLYDMCYKFIMPED